MEFRRTNSSRLPLSSTHFARQPSTPKKGCNSARRPSAPGTPPKIPQAPATAALQSSAHGHTLPRPDGFRRCSSSASVDLLQCNQSLGVLSRENICAEEGSSVGGKKHKLPSTLYTKTGGNGRVNVYARVRDFSKEGGEGPNQLAVHTWDNKVEITVPSKGTYTFTLDGSFWSVGSLDTEGQTGSGKTYTMFGPSNSLGTAERGLVPGVCDMIFERVASGLQKGIVCRVSVSMVEVYLEDIFDLFDNRKSVTLHKNYKDNSYRAVDAKMIHVRCYKDVEALLLKAEPLRTFAATAIHSRSSRAHTLFQLELHTRFDSADIAPRVARILLADLAGCERIKLAHTDHGIPFEEARNINLSLLSLGSCIEAVSVRKKATQNIPEFRNSTLTKLLKEYIGGNSVSAIVVTVAPGTRDARLSVQSLRFADRAMKVMSHARINTVPPSASGEGAGVPAEGDINLFKRKKEALHEEFHMQGVLQKLHHKITVLEEQLMSAADDEVVARLREEIGAYQKSLADADMKLNEQRRVLYANEAILEEQVKEMNAKMQEMREEHEEAVENILDDERRLNAERMNVWQEEHNERVIIVLLESRTICQHLMGFVGYTSAVNSRLAAKLLETEEELSTADKLVDEMQNALEELGDVSKVNENELRGYVESLRGEVGKLKGEAESKQGAYERDIAQQGELRSSLEAVLAERERQLEDLETQHRQLHESRLESEARLNDRITAYERDIAQQGELRSSLEAVLAERERQLEDLETQHRQLHESRLESEARLNDRITAYERDIAVAYSRSEAEKQVSEQLVLSLNVDLLNNKSHAEFVEKCFICALSHVDSFVNEIVNAFSEKIQSALLYNSAVTIVCIEDLLAVRSERQQLLSEVMSLRVSVKAFKSSNYKRRTTVLALAESVQDIVSGIVSEMSDDDLPLEGITFSTAGCTTFESLSGNLNNGSRDSVVTRSNLEFECTPGDR
uniref:Putative kinesin n=1 Tax=Trypanosoma vivax (strain Y486) TaxID=1055687 RepID=G0U183_TRYVY|nr:putative kinesin, fragment [Trypanosoma vivax Y486]